MGFSMVLHCNHTYEDESTCVAYYQISYPTTANELRRKAQEHLGWSTTAGPPISDYCPRHNPSDPGRNIPLDVVKAFETMKAAVHHGVHWDGNPESIGGVTKEEALDTASDFITTFETWLAKSKE